MRGRGTSCVPASMSLIHTGQRGPRSFCFVVTVVGFEGAILMETSQDGAQLVQTKTWLATALGSTGRPSRSERPFCMYEHGYGPTDTYLGLCVRDLVKAILDASRPTASFRSKAMQASSGV